MYTKTTMDKRTKTYVYPSSRSVVEFVIYFKIKRAKLEDHTLSSLACVSN